jgi:hypothetical protein
VRAGDNGERLASIQRYGERRREGQTEIQLAARDHLSVAAAPPRFQVAEVSEAFRAQQLLCEVLRRGTDATELAEADRARLRRPLVGERSPGAQDTCGAGCRQAGQEITAILHELHSKSPWCNSGPPERRNHGLSLQLALDLV